MPRPYSDYINVNKEFVPVFDKNADEKYPDHWKSFYPHDTFINILGDLISTLEGTSPEKRLSLWVSGAYGTGKSFASFTLKHIIEEDNLNVSSYFNKYNISSTLLSRLTGVKSKGDILVVNRSSSAGIVGDNRLFAALQDSVKQALKAKGYKIGGSTLYDNILDRLKDEHGTFNFKGAFNKYRQKFLAYQTHESVIDALVKLGAEDGLDLLEQIIEVADLEGLNFAKTADDIVMWLEDIIKINNLNSVVFIWDEFTEYFKKNQNSITGFQELAQASIKIPFYLLIITHKAHGHFIVDNDRRKILEARFKTQKIEMANTTAFMLMRQAIDFVPDLKSEWDNNSQNLWIGVEKSVKNTINKYAEDVNNDDLKALLPLHPFAAFLLRRISVIISSNQRTMFQFLCGDPQVSETTKHNFRWFIETNEYNLGKWCLLTCDYIWDYFFGESMNDNKTDLDESAKSAIIHFNNFAPQCRNENETRGLKVLLLLTAMQEEKGRGVSNLLRPTLSNISAAFAGTPIEDEIRNIMTEFVRKGIVGSMPEGSDVLYITQSQTIDPERYAELERSIRSDFSFEKLIANTDYNLSSNFSLNGYANLRFEVKCVTYKHLKTCITEIRNLPRNRVPLILMFAKTEEDSVHNTIAAEKVVLECERDIIIADLGSQPFSEMEYENFIKCQVKASYFFKVNQNEANLNKKNAIAIVETFKRKINDTNITLHSKVSQPISISGIGQLITKLTEINSKIFQYGLESLTQNDRFFASSGFSVKVPMMGMDKETIPSSFSYLNVFKNDMVKSNIWSNPNYETAISAHTLSQMKVAIESCIEKSFETRSSVSIADIWEVLTSKPFGIMECTGSAFIMGFLLRDYADNGYYLKDGIKNNVLLTNDKLADMIFGIIRNIKDAGNRFIVKMTEEHEIFCKYSGDIFKLSADKQNSISDVLLTIRGILPTLGFPLWALKTYIDKNDEQGNRDLLLPIIDLYCEFVSPTKVTGRDETKIAEDIAKAFKKDAVLKDHLGRILNSQNMKEGMGLYIADFSSDIVTLSQQLNIEKGGYIGEVKKRFTIDSSWLWDKGEIDKRINEVLNDYRLLEATNRILHTPINNLVDAAIAIKNRLSALKMPYEFFKGDIKELEPLFLELIKIFKTKSFADVDKKLLYKELCEKSESFTNFYSSQQKTFTENVIRLFGQSITNDDILHLYNSIETNALTKQLEDFLNGLDDAIIKFQKAKKYNILVDKWNELTNESNPAKWSMNNTIPILCLFTDTMNEAKEVFDIINDGVAPFESSKTEKAIEFLTSNNNISILNDSTLCDQIFNTYISGDYDLLITDIKAIKTLLLKKLGNNVYQWVFNKGNLDKAIKEYAENKYKSEYFNEVMMKIDRLDPEAAKSYLKELIKNEPLVGIKIMKN